MTSHDNTWNKRSVDYNKIHGESPDAYSALVSAIRPHADMTIGDIMSGYGAVSKELLEYCGEAGLQDFAHRPTPVRMILTDGFAPQLKRSVTHLSRYNSLFDIHRICADTRALPLRTCLDAAVIKHGLHELPKADHVHALQNIHRTLKPDSNIFVWEMMGATLELTAVAREILRTKDMIAGYESLVRNRYFAHDTEIQKSLETAGFDQVHDIYVGPFHYETKNFLEADLQSDQTKLQQLNAYIREHVPTDAKDALEFTDHGDSIKLTFVKKIIQATA